MLTPSKFCTRSLCQPRMEGNNVAIDAEQVEGSISLCRLPQGVLREQIKTTECEQSRERLKDKSLKRAIRKPKQLEN